MTLMSEWHIIGSRREKVGSGRWARGKQDKPKGKEERKNEGRKERKKLEKRDGGSIYRQSLVY